MQCKLLRSLPSGPDWRYELKLDGYRAEGIKTPDGVRLISRNQKDLSAAYPEVTDAVGQLPLRQGVLDGEIVAVESAGRPSFQGLQHAGPVGDSPRPIFYFVFDVLNLEGKSLVSLPLLDRKRLLERLLRKSPAQVRFACFLPGEADHLATAICEHNLEGVVAKLAHSPYEPDRRSGSWVKWKCGFEQEFVIGGYTRGQGGRTAFGALIVGYYEGGTGLDVSLDRPQRWETGLPFR